MQSVIVLALVVAAAGFIGTMTVQQSKLAKKKRQDIEFGIQIQSGIETLLLAYRLEEIRYIEAVAGANCDSANPFLQALKEGSGCANLSSMVVFKDSNLSAEHHKLFNYVANGTAGCDITPTVSGCNATFKELVQVGITNPAQKMMGATYQFFLNTVFPEKNLAEFVVHTKIEGSDFDLKRSFAIRPVLPNAAHLEADGRVTQENPDPLAKCQGAIWATFSFFNPGTQSCQTFVNLGSGTGLAYYKGRYFGFRPADGQMIDMMNASDPTAQASYLVDEAGKVGAETLFVPYSKSELINVDDVTLIENQIYYVAFSGAAAHIGLLDGTNTRKMICPLGELGWSQAYSGIAALSWGDKLDPPTVKKKLAVFFLKSDAGDLFTVAVTSRSALPRTPIYPAGYRCTVFKDANLQQVEYKRTNGFDRTSDSKPYYIY